MQLEPRIFKTKDAALLAYAIAFSIDLDCDQADLYSYYKGNGQYNSPDIRIAINDTLLVLREECTISSKDHPLILEWFNILFRFRLGIYFGTIVEHASIENREDISEVYGGLFGLRDLPSELEVAFLNAEPGDSNKIRKYSTLFKGSIAKVRKERYLKPDEETVVAGG